jgi:hypothetical protein
MVFLSMQNVYSRLSLNFKKIAVYFSKMYDETSLQLQQTYRVIGKVVPVLN